MNGFAQGELLGRVQPDGTSPVPIFTATMRTEIMLIVAVVLSDSPDISVYHDDDGVLFDSTTQIFLRPGSAGDGPFIFQAPTAGGGIFVRPGGVIAVQTSVAEAVTFSVYGITATLAERVRGLD